MMLSFQDQQGQVGLIVLLIAAVILTVGISVATRSVSEVSLTQQEEASTESLNVAEAGIEELLSRDLFGLYSQAGTSYYDSVDGADIEITPQNSLNDIAVFEGHSVEFDLTGAAALDQLRIEWGGMTQPAFVVTVINANGSQMRRYVNDAYSRIPNATTQNPFTVTLGIASPKVARIKVLYQAANDMNVIPVPAGAWTPPVQYHVIRSQAANVVGSSRAIEVFKTRPQLPSIFDYVLFSGTSLQ